MAKNIPNHKALVMIKRHLNEPSMPYLAENKLDHAMFELRNAKQGTLRMRNILYISIAVNVLLTIITVVRY